MSDYLPDVYVRFVSATRALRSRLMRWARRRRAPEVLTPDLSVW